MHAEPAAITRFSGLQRWRDIANVLQVQFDFDAPRPHDFVGSIAVHELGLVRLYEIEATAHVVRRNTAEPACGELPRTLVTLHEAGAGAVEHRGKVHALAPGDMTILHSAQPFTLHFPGPMREHVIGIPAQLLSHEMIASRHLAAISIPCREGIGRIARELLASTLASVADLSTTERERVARSLIDVFNAFAGSVLERGGKDLMDTRAYQLERILLYMHENLRDPALSAPSIAEALGISRRYIDKLFEREGTTVGRALLARRLEGGHRDLVDPYKRARSVSEIAYAWGFNSTSHFSRAFRQRFGITPRDARGAACHAD